MYNISTKQAFKKLLAAALQVHSSGQVAETTEEETGEKSNGSSTASPGESKIESIKASRNSYMQ